MNKDILTLLEIEETVLPDGGVVRTGHTRSVFAERRSVGMKEIYEAFSVGLRPELVFRLADALDYRNERYAVFEDMHYKVLRTYRAPDSTELDVVLERTTVEGLP